MATKRCASVGCKNAATHVLNYSFPGERDQPVTDLVCQSCGEGYVRRPTLKAELRPLGVPVGRKRCKLFIWEGVLTDYTSGMAVAVAPTLEAAYAVLMAQGVSDYGMQEIRSTDPTVVDSLTCEPQVWYVSGGG